MRLPPRLPLLAASLLAAASARAARTSPTTRDRDGTDARSGRRACPGAEEEMTGPGHRHVKQTSLHPINFLCSSSGGAANRHSHWKTKLRPICASGEMIGPCARCFEDRRTADSRRTLPYRIARQRRASAAELLRLRRAGRDRHSCQGVPDKLAVTRRHKDASMRRRAPHARHRRSGRAEGRLEHLRVVNAIWLSPPAVAAFTHWRRAQHRGDS